MVDADESTELWRFSLLFAKCILEILLSGPDVISVTKLGDLLDFGQLFKAFGIN